MTPDCQIIHGDCRTELVKLPERSVHMCVTSPPYHGLRKYEGVEPSVWGNAWTGLLGLEPHVNQYVYNIVECMRSVMRVLRDDGTLWVVVGDRIVDGQFAGVTWKLAEAMKADRWLLRCPIVWFKTDANMDSASGRPRMRHEYILVFAKSTNHYFDQDAVEHLWRGSVWPIATSNIKSKHFASFPHQLVEKCVRLGSSERGCCPECGTPWVRMVHRDKHATRPGRDTKKPFGDAHIQNTVSLRERHVTEVKTLGWRAGCESGIGCDNWEPIPCTVLDPFVGSGTAGIVARQQGRNFIGIDASETYANMARRRIANPEPEAGISDAEGQLTMFEEATA